MWRRLRLIRPSDSKRLEHAVDVDGGQRSRVGKLFLRHGQLISSLRASPRISSRTANSHKHMGDALASVPPSDVHDPFAKNSRLDQGELHDGPAEVRMVQHQLLDVLPGHIDQCPTVIICTLWSAISKKMF